MYTISGFDEYLSHLSFQLFESFVGLFQRKAMVYFCDESAGGSRYHRKRMEEALTNSFPMSSLPNF